MRCFLLLFTVLLLCVPQKGRAKGGETTAEYDTYLKWDFQGGGIPEGFKVFEKDALYYMMAPSHFGFNDEKPWIWAVEKEGSNNAVMACFPFYMYTKENPRKQSEDWLVTPGFRVTPKQGKLVWKSRTDVVTWGGQGVEKFRGSYNVYISTKGQNFEDFPQTPAFRMEGDSLDWYEHSVDVSQYHGQTIYVAFASQTFNEEFPGMVLVDDVELAGEKRPVQQEMLTGKYQYGEQDVTLKCRFTAVTDIPVTALKAFYSYNENTYTKELTGINLQKGESCTVEFDEKIHLAVSDTARFSLWIEANGESYVPQEYELVCLSFKPERKVVVEDGSGMWCGYCAIGIPAFEKMKANYPDQFIGIVVHRGDALVNTPYDTSLGLGDLPAASINRRYVTNNLMVIQNEGGKQFYTTLNGGIETFFLKELEETVTPASVSLTGGYTDQTQKKIRAKTEVTFALDYPRSDFRVAFVLVENHVKGEGFYQNNSYNSFKGDAGGLEGMGSILKDPVFEEVARGIYDFDGIPGSIPSRITAGQPVSYEHEIDVPEVERGPQIVPNNLELVAMIIDASTGQIVNADKVMLGNPQGISPENAQTALEYSVAGGVCTVLLPEGFDGELTAALIDLNGRRLAEIQTAGSAGSRIAIPVDGLSGVCFLRVVSKERTAVARIVIR